MERQLSVSYLFNDTISVMSPCCPQQRRITITVTHWLTYKNTSFVELFHSSS